MPQLFSSGGKARATRGKFLALVAIVLTGLIMTLLARRPAEQFAVVGSLSDQEVEEIAAAVRKKLRPPIVRDLSLPSLCAAPQLLRYRLTTRILRIEARTHGFVVVITGSANHPQDDGCVFWGVFREPTGWAVGFDAPRGAVPAGWKY